MLFQMLMHACYWSSPQDPCASLKSSGAAAHVFRTAEPAIRKHWQSMQPERQTDAGQTFLLTPMLRD